MIPFYVTKDVLGSRHHLFVSDEMSWTDDVDDSRFVLSAGDYKLSVAELALVSHRHVVTEPQQNVVAPYKSLMSGSVASVPWRDALTDSQFASFARSVVSSTRELLSDERSVSYYCDVWVPSTRAFASLQRAHVDHEKYDVFVRSNEGNVSALLTFEPDSNGGAREVRYNRHSTHTGRLTVSSGPSILTLSKQHRAILRSSWSDGCVCMVDFSSLDTRVVLHDSGMRCDERDVYAFVNRTVLDGKNERDNVKRAVISLLYKRTDAKLLEDLCLSGDEGKRALSKLKRLFDTRKILQRAKAEYVADNGFVRNRYGRRIVVERPIDRVFINSYVQSTAHDVTMLGFTSLVDRWDKDLVKPLFFLHDALVLDVHPSMVEEIMTLSYVNVQGYVQKFPVVVKKL